MSNQSTANTRFLDGVDSWIGVLGQLRDVVRQQVLAAQLAEVLADRNLARAKVLDVGCGQGTQALLLARAGPEVTGLDISADLPARFESALSAEPTEVRARVWLVQGPGEAAEVLGPLGWRQVAWYGVRVFTDHRYQEVPPPPEELSLLLEVEQEAGRRDPYRQVAALLHVVYARD